MIKLPADWVARLRRAYEGRSVCVTGGAGFIGGHLVDALLSLGSIVSVIDDLSNSTLQNLSEHIELEPDRIRFVHGSILDDDALGEAAARSLTVFHLAAMGSVPRSIAEPQRTWSVNATGTVRVLEHARRAGAKRVVFASSSSVYGDGQELPKRESGPTRPLSPYAASKLAAEQALTAWSASYGLSTVALRYFNVFGPRQQADSSYAAVVAAFAARLLAGEAPVIYGDGEQSRDFTYVSNAVLGTLLAGAVDRPLAGEAMNIGTGSRVTVRQLARVMWARGGSAPVEPEFRPRREGDVLHSQADISRARELIGFEPIAGVEEGLGQTIEWYRQAGGLAARRG